MDLNPFAAGRPDKKLILSGQADPSRYTILRSRCGFEIVAERPQPQSDEAMRMAASDCLKACPRATLRNLAWSYNCVGLVFGDKRASIDTDKIRDVLAHDRYAPVSLAATMAGDIVLYTDSKGELTHIGFVMWKEKGFVVSDNDVTLWVLSQWGCVGEYLHPVQEVPCLYGKPTEYWTDRNDLARNYTKSLLS